jgi:integrase
LKINENVDWEVKLNVNKSDGNIFILTDEEFEKLRKKELVLRLDRVRDIYVLGCSTGLRYSDLIRLDTEHVRGSYIEIVTQKNGVFCRIPLNEISASILEKYNNCPPRISDQKLNKYLYELFRNMEITDKVSTIEWRGNQKKTVVYERCDLLSIHTSRKFFITNCISNGITSDSIMKWTGQSTLKVFYDYVLKGKKEVEQMKKIFKL